jgi:hypothetical protein
MVDQEGVKSRTAAGVAETSAKRSALKRAPLFFGRKSAWLARPRTARDDPHEEQPARDEQPTA